MSTRSKPLADVEWTHDCQGKQDFDCAVVRVSTRYWPRGGGYFLVNSGVSVQDSDARPEVKPSATSAIMFMDKDLVKKNFEADTEEEVKRQVEAWANEQVIKVRELLEAKLVRGKK